MKNVKRMLSLLLLAVLMGTLMTTAVLADETQRVWLSVTEDPDNGSVTALIVTNTTVTDGLVKLSYDSSALTYSELAVNSDYVAQYSVNPNQAGTVKIGWVAPGEYTADGTGLSLMTVTFTGTDGSSLELSGVIHDAAGNEISLIQLHTDALAAAIASAEALDPAAYTAESWVSVAAALAEAKAVLADPTATQSETDAAAAALNAAISALEAAPTVPPTEAPITPDDGNNSQTGDETPLVPIFIIMGLCLAAIIILAVILLRKGRKE